MFGGAGPLKFPFLATVSSASIVWDVDIPNLEDLTGSAEWVRSGVSDVDVVGYAGRAFKEDVTQPFAS